MKEEKPGMLVGVHFNKFFGRPGRMWIQDNKIHVQPHKGSTHVYDSSLKITRKLTEPLFANHWIELHSADGTPVWLTCSKSRAEAIAKLALEAGLTVEEPRHWKTSSSN